MPTEKLALHPVLLYTSQTTKKQHRLTILVALLGLAIRRGAFVSQVSLCRVAVSQVSLCRVAVSIRRSKKAMLLLLIHTFSVLSSQLKKLR